MTISFVDRFQHVWRRKRRVQFGQAAAAAALAAICMFSVLAAGDFVFEFTPLVRSVGLAAGAVAVAAVAGWGLWLATRRGTRPRTAAEVESAFPQLGQAVRTTVEFASRPAEQIQAEGVKESLVAALAEQTEERTRPLEIDVVVPVRRFWALAASACALVVVVASAYGFDWEWRTAARRAVLDDIPYRALQVFPGDFTVDEGDHAEVSVTLIGRTDRDVVFQTRPAGQPGADWTQQTLEPVSAARSAANPAALPSADSGSTPSPDRPRLTYVAALGRLMEPLDYRVTTGDVTSRDYQLTIRRPVRIHNLHVELTPPAYTGQPTTTVEDGNVAALLGTSAQFIITFDKPLRSAALVFDPPRNADPATQAPLTMPLALEMATGDDNAQTASVGKTAFELTSSETYTIVAEGLDGTRLRDNKFRIRVRDDQPPQVSFESPNDAVEVHTLAELPIRVRLTDDYGLTSGGVIFQVNNEQEIPLLAEDFATVMDAAGELERSGALSPRTQATLERVLPLEYFALTQKDSVMYFAYAVDNRPGSPQRTETDMHFIDIRPFKRMYRVVDPDPGTGLGGAGLKSLEELIQRQRFGLNRTLTIERRAAAGRLPDATTLDQLMQFEAELAQNIADTAGGLEARGFDDTELFYQAQSAILKAVDSLSVAKWESATLQMRDALKLLIEQRDRTLEFLLKNPDAAMLAALRQFDRLQAQKLRRPKTDKEEARELVRRLEALISEEHAVAAAIDPASGPANVQPAPETESPAALPAESPQPADGGPPEPAGEPAAAPAVEPAA